MPPVTFRGQVSRSPQRTEVFLRGSDSTRLRDPERTVQSGRKGAEDQEQTPKRIQSRLFAAERFSEHFDVYRIQISNKLLLPKEINCLKINKMVFIVVSNLHVRNYFS